jgi:hypothetical protein
MRVRRLRVAAIVALEAAHISFAVAGSGRTERDLTQLLEAREVIEVGCRLLRQNGPTEFERLWLLASVAVVQSTQNNWFTYTSSHVRASDVGDGRQVNSPWEGTIQWIAQNASLQEWDTDHWRHATSRFPSEFRFELAKILVRPETRRMPNRPGTSATFMTQGLGANIDFDPPWKLEPEAVKFVQRASIDLSALADAPGVGAEVRLRRGILQFHRANLAESLRDLSASSDAPDPFVAYLANLYTGLAFDGLDRRSEAVDAYRAALQTIPNARSGVLALAADLFLLERRTEASALLETAFAAPAPIDPWRQFSLGDYRFWPAYLARLREALRS